MKIVLRPTFSADLDLARVSRKLCAFFSDLLKLLIRFNIGSWSSCIYIDATLNKISPGGPPSGGEESLGVQVCERQQVKEVELEEKEAQEVVGKR